MSRQQQQQQINDQQTQLVSTMLATNGLLLDTFQQKIEEINFLRTFIKGQGMANKFDTQIADDIGIEAYTKYGFGSIE